MASTAAAHTLRGGAFLVEMRGPADVFTPEDFTEEHREIARTPGMACRRPT